MNSKVFDIKTLLIFLLAASGQNFTYGQQMSLPDAVEFALKHNNTIGATGNTVQAMQQLKRTSADLPKTEISMMRGQYNSYARNDNNFTIIQSIPFAAFGAQRYLNNANLASAELKKNVAENELVYEVRRAYYQLVYQRSIQAILVQQDSLFREFARSTALRYKSGEATLLEKTTAESQRNQSATQLVQISADIEILRTTLKRLLNSTQLPDTNSEVLRPLEFQVTDSTDANASPLLKFSRQQIDVAEGERKLMASRAAPDLSVGYFNQTLIGTVDPETSAIANKNNRFSGFQVGLTVPLWFFPQAGRMKAAAYNKTAAQMEFNQTQTNIENEIRAAIHNCARYKSTMEFYRSSALSTGELLISQAQAAFRAGEIGYAEYLLAVRNGMQAREGYMKSINDLNQSIIYLEYLTGKQL